MTVKRRASAGLFTSFVAFWSLLWSPREVIGEYTWTKPSATAGVPCEVLSRMASYWVLKYFDHQKYNVLHFLFLWNYPGSARHPGFLRTTPSVFFCCEWHVSKKSQRECGVIQQKYVCDLTTIGKLLCTECFLHQSFCCVVARFFFDFFTFYFSWVFRSGPGRSYPAGNPNRSTRMACEANYKELTGYWVKSNRNQDHRPCNLCNKPISRNVVRLRIF